MLKVKITVDKDAVRKIARSVVNETVSEDDLTEFGRMEDLLYEFGGKRQISLFENIVAEATNPEVAKAVSNFKRRAARARAKAEKAKEVGTAVETSTEETPETSEAE